MLERALIIDAAQPVALNNLAAFHTTIAPQRDCAQVLGFFFFVFITLEPRVA